MNIAEIYKSVQGEGFLTGTESIFVRAAGCNLRCWFCDTPYTSWKVEGHDLSVSNILQQVGQWDCKHVVITGGEPMLFSELIPLCDALHQAGKHITIETAGTLYLPLKCDLMSLSPKLANSTPPADSSPRWHQRHEQTRYNPDCLLRLIKEHKYQVKFVVDSLDDCREVNDYLNNLSEIDQSRIMLMPQGTQTELLQQTASWLEPYCQENSFHFCPRKQIEWFGLVRGV